MFSLKVKMKEVTFDYPKNEGCVGILIPAPFAYGSFILLVCASKERGLFEEEGTVEHSVSHPATVEYFMEVY